MNLLELIELVIILVFLSTAVYAVSSNIVYSQKVYIGNSLDMLEIGESIGSVTPVLSYPQQADLRMARLYAQSATTQPKFDYRFKNKSKTLK